MGIRKPIFKIIIGALILSLVMVGTVPAKESCKGACGCCKKTENQSEFLAIHPTEYHRIQDFDNISAIFHRVHMISSIRKAVQRASGCHKGNASVPCDMEPFRALDAFKGLTQSISRGEHSPLCTLVFASSEIDHNTHLFAGLTTRHLMLARAAPSRLFLQKSSFLC